MSPAFTTNLAIRLWPRRSWALACSLLAFVAVALVVTFGSPTSARIAAVLAGPAVGLPWALLCVASWFHPENGTMSASARFMNRLPPWLQGAARWYASVFSMLFVLFCAVLWPALALSNLWLLVY